MNQSFVIDVYTAITGDSGYWASMYSYDEYLTGLPIAEGEGDTADAAVHDLFANVQRTLTFDSIAREVEPSCDVCGVHTEEAEWCGDCGCCQKHCQSQVDCEEVSS